jgi:transportin-1
MVFSEMDRVTYEEDSQKPDRDQDINPKNFFSHPKNHSGHQSSVSINDSDSEGDDEENDQWDDSGDDWTLRKSSSLTLDNIANYYKDVILELTLPVIQQKMDMKQEWYIRESSILALGAISEGCRSGMEKYLPELIPYLLTVLNDPKPLVRCITCWTIGRYSAWIVAQKSSNIFPSVLKGILEKMMDSNKKVQESSCSTFIGLIEMGRKEIYPFIFPCLQAISKSFSYYSVLFLFFNIFRKKIF